MNLATLRSRVAQTVGLAGATTGHPEQALIDGWYNEAVEQFLLETKAVKKTAVLSTTAGQGDYTLDHDVLAFEDVYLESGDYPDVMLPRVDTYDLRQARRLSTNMWPGVYAYDAGVLMLHPAPADGTTIHIVYVAKPALAMSADAHAPDQANYGGIPSQYHPVLESYVKWRAAGYSNDAPSQNGQTYRQEWEQGLVRARVTEARRGGLVMSAARVGRPRRRGAPGNGVDVGY